MPLRIEKLCRDHRVDPFDCGKEPLNRFLIRFAHQAQLSGSSQTYVALRDDEVVGYYTLVFGDVAFDDAPERLRKGMARHPIPLMILARLAVADASTGKGIGSGLLKDAMLRTLAAADIAGLRAFAVHAKDEEARSFYAHFDFVESPSDPMHLFLLKGPAPARRRCISKRGEMTAKLSCFMKVDARGRILIPLAMRPELGILGSTSVEIQVVDGDVFVRLLDSDRPTASTSA